MPLKTPSEPSKRKHMKTIVTTLLLLSLWLQGQAKESSYDKLVEVNKCWLEQKDLPKDLGQAAAPHDERSWIQHHLQLVEQTLRSRSTARLSAEQAAKRAQCLDLLNAYWHAQQFPINDQYSYRTPIFIDRYDNFCAVGYLVKASGHENISRMIAAKTNLAYVREMRYPELKAWADTHGFTVDELAWIQPAYPSVQSAQNVGKGVNGNVKEFYADENSGRLYVGGSFSKVDDSISANNIAYVTEQNGKFTWHAMGNGVNGTVNAIAELEGKIYIAGEFSMSGLTAVNNVAMWDGTTWQPVGCTWGKVHDLAVLDNALFAVGEFDVCASMADINFAWWTGSKWQQVPGLTSKVNTMEVHGQSLILGGKFKYQNQDLNVIKWTPNATLGTFEPYSNSIGNEVRDFELFHDTLYAVCKRINSSDTSEVIYQLNGQIWEPLKAIPHWGLSAVGGEVSMNSLCSDGDRLMIGGAFRYLPMVGHLGSNSISLNRNEQITGGEWMTVDSTVHKVIRFKQYLIAGGSFKNGAGKGPGGAPSLVSLNGIARRDNVPANVPGTKVAASFSLSPNPVMSAGKLQIKGVNAAQQYAIYDMLGKQVAAGALSAKTSQELQLPELAPGVYTLKVTGIESGAKQFVVR